MLKIKLLIVAILAVGFATGAFASQKKVPTANSSSKAPGDIDALPAPKPAKWTASQCEKNCTKAKCKGLKEGDDESATPTPAQTKVGMAAGLACALNCKSPDKAATMVDCVIPLYAAKCLNAKAAAAEGKAGKVTNCHHLSNAISSILVGPVYLQRDNADKPEAASAWEALKALDVSASANAG